MKDDHEALRMTTQWLWDNMQGDTKEEGESEWCCWRDSLSVDGGNGD